MVPASCSRIQSNYALRLACGLARFDSNDRAVITCHLLVCAFEATVIVLYARTRE